MDNRLSLVYGGKVKFMEYQLSFWYADQAQNSGSTLRSFPKLFTLYKGYGIITLRICWRDRFHCENTSMAI